MFVIGLLQLTLLLALFLVGEIAQLGSWYRLGLLVTGGLMIYQHLLIRDRQPANCFAAFLNNRHIGAAVFIGIALDYTFRQSVG